MWSVFIETPDNGWHEATRVSTRREAREAATAHRRVDGFRTRIRRTDLPATETQRGDERPVDNTA